jgi:hypothetical protein
VTAEAGSFDSPSPEALDDAVAATVAYSDVFDMPVTTTEVRRYLVGVRAGVIDVERSADRLVDEGVLGRRGDLLHLAARPEVLAIHDDRARRAELMWPAARRWSRVIGRLPFVRMVAVTGGLACDSVEDHDDIDLFIVTAPGRLWLTRLAVVSVVRLVGLRGPELCPNYLVADDSLAMDVRTLYVARELAQTVPLVGVDCWRELLEVNSWYRDLLPNAGPVSDRSVGGGRPGKVRRVVEWVLRRSVLDGLERWEMNRKVARLTGVASRRPEVGAPDEAAFSPSVCKGHLEGNAAGIEVAWRERVERLGGSGS